MSQTRVEATFTVTAFEPVEIGPELVETAMESGVATMEKRYFGAVEGRSTTLFSSSRDAETGAGTYVALEGFEGTLNGSDGAFNFLHSASTHGEDRYGEFFAIVDGSGTSGLTGIGGSGGMAVDPDGTHRMWFDYTLG